MWIYDNNERMGVDFGVGLGIKSSFLNYKSKGVIICLFNSYNR